MKINLFEFVTENPGNILILFGTYLAAGVAWSFVKWVSFLYNFKEYRETLLDGFRKNKGDDGYRRIIKKEPETEFEYLSKRNYKNSEDLTKPPSYRDYKAKIVAWVVFWIPSLIGTVLDDFVRKLVTWIVNRFSAFYQLLSNKIVGNITEPIPAPVPMINSDEIFPPKKDG